MGAEIKVRASFDGSQVRRGIDELREKASAWAGSMAVKFLGYAAVIGLVSRAYSTLRQTAKEFGDVSDRAARLNVSPADLQRIEFAATEAGVSAEKASKLLDKLRVSMSLAGRDEKLRKNLEAVGVTADIISANDPGRAFKAMADSLAQMTEPQRLAALKDVFGNRMAVDAFALLRDAAKFKEDMAEAPILNEVDVQKLAEADAILERMERRLAVMKANAVSALAGVAGIGNEKLFKSNEQRLREQYTRLLEMGRTSALVQTDGKPSDFTGPRGTLEHMATFGGTRRASVAGMSEEDKAELRKIQSEQFVAALTSSGMSLPSIVAAATKTPEELADEIRKLRDLGGVQGLELVTPESILGAAEEASKKAAEAKAGEALAAGPAGPAPGAVVATSLQTVGGGGFAVASDLVVDRLDRIASASERSADALEREDGPSGVEPGDY